jgi:hypothetical protein
MGSERYYKGLRSKLARVRVPCVQVKAELVFTRGKYNGAAAHGHRTEKNLGSFACSTED